MLFYFLKCRKNTESKDPKVVKTKKRENVFIKMWSVWSKFIKEQEASGLLSSLGIKTPLSKILLVLRVLNKLIQGIKQMK